MAQRKVRHALVTVQVRKGVYETYFRGETVDVPDAEIARLEALGAVVPATAELQRPGTLAPLSEGASDEELVAWVLAATDSELTAELQRRPDLAPRVIDARKLVVDRQEAMLNRLREAEKLAQPIAKETEKAAAKEAREAEAAAKAAAKKSAPAKAAAPSKSAKAAADDAKTSETPSEPITATGGVDPDSLPANLDAGQADTIVSGSPEEVSEFLSLNPEQAQAILEAEQRRASAADEDVRAGVVEAAKAAIAHTASG